MLIRSTALTDFIVKTDIPKVDLMPAGSLDQTYAELVSTFDWRAFFNRAPSLVRSVAEALAARYDYILIDSRTGLNDISGVCTALMPERLVFVFTPNRQSLVGGSDVLRKAATYRRQSEDIRPLMVFPLPSRVDVSEPKLLEKWRFGDDDLDSGPGYQSRFEILFADIYGLPSCNLRTYFDEVQIQHVPRYSYGEDIAAQIERGNRLSISRSYASFTDILAEAESPWSPLLKTKSASLGLSQVSPKIDAVKELLTEERFKVKLRDLVSEEVRGVLSEIADKPFTTRSLVREGICGSGASV